MASFLPIPVEGVSGGELLATSARLSHYLLSKARAEININGDCQQDNKYRTMARSQVGFHGNAEFSIPERPSLHCDSAFTGSLRDTGSLERTY